jgi:hypothetical protein
MSWFWAHSAGPSICDNLLLARLVDPELRREAERLSPAVFEATPKELVDRGILPGIYPKQPRFFGGYLDPNQPPMTVPGGGSSRPAHFGATVPETDNAALVLLSQKAAVMPG